MWAYLLATIVIFGAGATSGGFLVKWQRDSADLKRERMESAEKGRKLAAADLGAVRHEGDKVIIRKEFVDREVQVETIVTKDKLVYSTICISPDGLSVIADSIAGRTSSSVITPAMPGASATVSR